MSQINHGKSDIMSTEKKHSFVIETGEQGAKFVNPSKGALTGKAPFVHVSIKEAFTAPFDPFAIALIFSHVGDKSMIETDFARCFGVKGAIGVEERP